LLLRAGDAVDAATAASARLQELHKQRDQAALALARQQDKASAAQAEWQAWQVAWQSATADAGLAPGTAVAAAEGALAVMASIDGKLREMQELRHARIDTMQRDLRDFAQDVALLRAQAAPELAAAEAADVVVELAARLARAQTAQQEATRLQREIGNCQAQAQAAQTRLAHAQATLAPLLHQAGVDSRDALRDAIALSDRRRTLQAPPKPRTRPCWRAATVCPGTRCKKRLPAPTRPRPRCGWPRSATNWPHCARRRTR
jgi:uncharacterized protein YhaN